MKKFAVILLSAAIALASGSLMAANGNGDANEDAAAGAVSGGAKQNLPPNNVDNSSINNGTKHHSHSGHNSNKKWMSTSEMNKNSQCKDGNCPDTNEKVQTRMRNNTDTATDGTTQ